MKRLLILLFLVFSTFASTDYAIAVFKLGDQEQANGFKDGELIEVIDPNEQADGFVLSEDMMRIFLCVKIPLSDKGKFRSLYKDTTGNTKCIIRPQKLLGGLNSLIRDKDAVKGLIDIESLNRTAIDTGSNLSANPAYPDYNAWTGGDVTVGSGGTYATWTALAADAGTFTSNGTATQISDVTEAATLTIGNDISTYTQTLDGAGYLFNYSQNTSHGIVLGQEGTGTVDIKNFTFNRTATASASTFAALITAAIGSVTLNIHECIFDGGGYVISGLRVADVSPVMNVYNNLFYDINGDATSTGLLIDAADGNSSSIYENNTFYNCSTSVNVNSNTGHMINNASFSITDYSNAGSLGTFSKCASSDATGSEAGLRSLTTADQFESLTDTDPDFLVPKTTGALYGAGANPTIVGHTTYYNGITILTDDVDIGANGVSRAAATIPALNRYFRPFNTFASWSRRLLRLQ